MAQKKSVSKKTSKKTSKQRHYPAVRSTELGATSETNAVRILDTAATLSRVNRRLYRFARVYPVSISMRPGSTGLVEVYALRDDWAVHQGVKMAYKMYLKNTDDERKALGKNMVARWEDFRITPGVTGNTLFPKLQDPTFAGGGTRLTGGEFADTNVVDVNNTRRTFTFGAPSITQYGILQEYNKAGNAQVSPADTFGVSGAYSDIDEEFNTGTATDLQTDGDIPPYDRNGVHEDSPWVKVATLGAGAAGEQKLSTGYFNAPCGLVVLVGPSSDWNSDVMHFEVQKGNYKGVGGMSLLE